MIDSGLDFLDDNLDNVIENKDISDRVINKFKKFQDKLEDNIDIKRNLTKKTNLVILNNQKNKLFKKS